ncbi:type I-C CRISPR-associated protein Cas5c [Lysinibacillus sphaericus]|uniref:pre-crRNA processing endonuclease n=1 Tax=Lysinibacillus sphaericus (strain C3-41) TaxID=444177 RepID=B1I0J0_LYSSC|nr:type I-C CRISPR-associated protein Cas5c [Lysinibacillus sphaericus]MBE5085804.1 type I-C CRISPR-associated protein Cas5 [Bacillus thuringiensis]ACA42349.1 conserved hypothetical protein [Lysinibacillus sphaericus C3-41]AMO35333.1 type I-C CRISPR-associated protein Cas5 [Lysinibacillus sphaericus]AMR93064.1 type I-C CRISPR-associated protein Cas5 [Lysinibacillus sphaericus]MBG9710596.1 CRISPR-associated protein [Lysinibacillus sphaericus]
MAWTIEFLVYGRNALFTDPFSKTGGEKTTTLIPTYEAMKGVAESIYWKPSIKWHIDSIRVMKAIRTESKGVLPRVYSGGKMLSLYTYLHDVAYQVRATISPNESRPDLKNDYNMVKHHQMALRSLDKGGRRDIFLGVRECQAYVEPCKFGSEDGEYDSTGTIGFGLMVHGFNYPNNRSKLFEVRFWKPEMLNGIINFPKPSDCIYTRKIREMNVKQGARFQSVDDALDILIREDGLGFFNNI